MYPCVVHTPAAGCAAAARTWTEDRLGVRQNLPCQDEVLSALAQVMIGLAMFIAEEQQVVCKEWAAVVAVLMVLQQDAALHPHISQAHFVPFSSMHPCVQ